MLEVLRLYWKPHWKPHGPTRLVRLGAFFPAAAWHMGGKGFCWKSYWKPHGSTRPVRSATAHESLTPATHTAPVSFSICG